MLFKKKNTNGVLKEVDDSRQPVYDFRRRTEELFENYRAIDFKMAPSYDLKNLQQEIADTLDRLISAHAVDAGNADCLIGKILHPVINGFCDLDNQHCKHIDFYTRQAERAATDISDIDQILVEWETLYENLKKEHEYTKRLWNQYRGYCEKEE